MSKPNEDWRDPDGYAWDDWRGDQHPDELNGPFSDEDEGRNSYTISYTNETGETFTGYDEIAAAMAADGMSGVYVETTRSSSASNYTVSYEPDTEAE